VAGLFLFLLLIMPAQCTCLWWQVFSYFSYLLRSLYIVRFSFVFTFIKDSAINSAHENHPSKCDGPTSVSEECDEQCCTKTDGEWSVWTDWGSCECDHTDGTASRTRTHSCTNPEPSCGGTSVIQFFLFPFFKFVLD